MNYRTHEKEEVNAARRKYTAALRAIEKAHYSALTSGEGTPKDAISAAFCAVGEEAVLSALASVVNACAWDGRISANNADWAAHYPGCLSVDTAERVFCLFTSIHRAHLDQLATIARRMQTT